MSALESSAGLNERVLQVLQPWLKRASHVPRSITLVRHLYAGTGWWALMDAPPRTPIWNSCQDVTTHVFSSGDP
eukprot:4295791-Amphidinium_carterae.1